MEEIKIIDYSPEHQKVWYDLNFKWISRDYDFEEIDHDSLSRPDFYFLHSGGSILLAEKMGEIIGTVALQPFGNDEFEMAKMTVAESARGQKIGEKLGIAILKRAREVGAKRVFLFSNTLAFEAINLYFKLGFRVCPLGSSEFKRANIKMEILLKKD